MLEPGACEQEAVSLTAIDRYGRRMIMPPSIWFACLAGSIVLHFVWPIDSAISFPMNLIGVLLIVAGSVITIWGDQLFKKHQTTIKTSENPTRVVTEGPFRFSRHPIYLGMILVLFGVGALLGSVSALLCPLVFAVFMDRFYLPMEEATLQQLFGEEYEQYRASVRRWL